MRIAQSGSLDARAARAVPFAQHRYVDVEFPATPDTDVEVVHQLTTPTPDAVNYQVMQADRAVSVYHDQSATRKPWTATAVRLRANVASAKVRLLLTVEQESFV